MEESLKNKCKLIVDNKLAIEKEFDWQGAVTNVFVSNVISTRNVCVDTERLRNAEKIIKKNTGIITVFRGYIRKYVAAVMSDYEDGEKLFRKIKLVNSALKKQKISRTSYRAVAATLICTIDSGMKKDDIVKNTKEIFSFMKSNHPIITAEEDITFATLLAMSGIDIEKLEDETEECYKALKGISKSNNAIQSLSHVLALGKEDALTKCNKVREIKNLLSDKKIKYGKGCELVALGGLALLNEGPEVIVEEIIKADAYLKDARGFGAFGIGETQRYMYAAIMVLSSHVEDIKNLKNVASEDEKALIIAEQTSIISTMVVASMATSQ